MIKIDGIESIADMMEDKKGGRKRSKKGGDYVKCPVCGTLYEPAAGKCPTCFVRKANEQKKTRNRREAKSRKVKRDTRAARRAQSPFRPLRIKKPAEGKKLSPQEVALNNMNDNYERQWQLGKLTPRSIVDAVIILGELYNTTVTQAQELLTTKKKEEEREKEEKDDYRSELLAYRCNLLIYYLLETAFVAIGMGIGYYSYEQALWTSFCIAEWIEATFPSYMRKKIQLEVQRNEADLKTQLFRDERDRLRKIKRDLSRGYNMRNNELPESEVPEILQLLDGDEKQYAIEEWKKKMGDQDPERPSRVKEFFGNVMDSVTGFVHKVEDDLYDASDLVADKLENSRRALGDGIREGFAPVTTLTGATGAQAEALNAVYPVFYVMGITLLYFYLFKNMFRHFNTKPNKPKRHGHGGRRKKTRKKRRKTRRKSKRRKRKRKTKRRKRRR